MIEEENIIQLEVIRTQRGNPRKCTCDPYKIKFTVDIVNREVLCECGIKHDAFEAIKNIADRYDDINRTHRGMSEQRGKWLNEKPKSVLFRKLEKAYHGGKMLPTCPHCKSIFDFDEIFRWVNAEFYKIKNP